jgi:hypothetical protein
MATDIVIRTGPEPLYNRVIPVVQPCKEGL